MKTLVITFLCIGLFYSCKPNSKKAEEEVVVIEEETPKEGVPTGDCYLLVQGKDSILIQMVVENNAVAGHLHYRFFEKDKSGGTVFGTMNGDTLIADYKFISEGTESEREVAFVRVGDSLVEGYGDVEESNGRMIFKKTHGP